MRCPGRGLVRTRGPVFRSEERASGYGHGGFRRVRAGIRCEIRGVGKLERGTDGRGEEAGILKGEKFDFLGGRQSLRSFLFLLLGFFDRVAHRARVGAVEGFFRTGKD